MSDELVTVATFNDPVEAAMARNYLEAGGVRAYLLDEETVAMNWGLGNAVGGIKLQVKAASAEKAEFLLTNLARPDPEDAAPDVPSIAIATRETVEDLRAEREREQREGAEAKGLAVDRLLRATVAGLIFWPVQFYALWLLMNLSSITGQVSPSRRWKVWASVLLNLPLWSFVLGSACFIAALLRR